MNRNDKRDVKDLSAASNGQLGGGKKRQRDLDDHNDNVQRNRRPASGPFTNMGQSNLHGDRRQSGGRGNGKPTGLKVRSREEELLAHKAFPRPPPSGILPTATATAPDSNSPSVSGQHTSDLSPPIPGLSAQSDDAMSGSLSLAEVLGTAPLPNSPESKEHTPVKMTPRGLSRSSPDPLNVIGSSTKPTSNSSTNPIAIDDDSTDEMVDISPSKKTRSPPRTPKGRTNIRDGYVRQTRDQYETKTQGTRGAQGAQGNQGTQGTQGTLEGFLTPAGRTQPAKPAQPGPSSRGKQIVPGATRPLPLQVAAPNPHTGQNGRIADRMKPKNNTLTGIKPSNVSTKAESMPTQQPARPKEKGLNQFPMPVKLKVQDWFCGSKHYTNGPNSRSFYSLSFNDRTISLDRLGSNFAILQKDIREFQVADTPKSEDRSEYIPALVFLLKDNFLNEPSWKNFSHQDNDPRVLVRFDAESEGFATHWQELIDRMTEWTQKVIVGIKAMNNIIAHIVDRSSHPVPVKKAEPKFVVPMVQDHQPPSKQSTPAAEPQVHTSAPSSKRITRSAVPNPNTDVHEPQPIPIQDPDKVMLVYPQAGAGAVTINRGELARLEPGEFLNDTLIELGLKMWLNTLREQDPTLADQIHVFSSFFFKKLDGGRGKACEYEKVKKWTAKFDLFSKKFIIIPINEHLHWYLAIICFPEHVLKAPPPHTSVQPTRVTRSSDAAAVRAKDPRMSSESDTPTVDKSAIVDVESGSPTELGQMEIDDQLANRSQKMVIDSPTPPEILSDAMIVDTGPSHDPEPVFLDMTNDDVEDKPPSQPTGDENSQKTWILILDSLGGKHLRTVRLLRQYLQSEAQERRQAVVELKDSKTSGGFVEDRHLQAPVQPNWCDCGIYLLHYVEVFYSNPLEILALPNNAKRKNNPQFQEYERLWQTELVERKRDTFRDKVQALSSAWLESRRSAPNDNANPTDSHPSRALPPPPVLEGDASVQLIEPPSNPSVPETVPEMAPNLAHRPPRSGVLSSDLGESSEGEVEVMTSQPSETTGSPSASKGTRRGRKGGSKHGSRPQSEETVASRDL